MNRANKKRRCRRLDNHKEYIPSGREMSNVEHVVIQLDEFEAMRLCDYDGLNQIQASEEMRISRATIQRLLNTGRLKIMDALLNDKYIMVNNETQNIFLKGENNMNKLSNNLVRIAFPTTDGISVDEHFGHCKSFMVFELENQTLKDQSILTPPPHAPGVLPAFLGDNNVDVIITGGMGQMAINLFKEQNIDVILGARGSIKDNLHEFLSGLMVSDGTPCDHHHQ